MQYIEWHATNNLDDNYLGSGKLLKSAIKKHGKDKFTREILEFCNEQNVLEQEKFWINKEKTLYPNGYNLTLGGDGRMGPKLTPTP